MIELSIHLETELCSRSRPNGTVQRKYINESGVKVSRNASLRNLSAEILTNSKIDTQLAAFLSQPLKMLNS